MYKNNKNGKILNIILGVLALIVIVFIIIWLVNKGQNSNSTSFTTTLTTLQETAKKYFADDLPEDIGDTKIIYLDELYAKGLSEKIFDGKTECDETLSYISATRSAEAEYKVKTNLVCGQKSDNLIEKIPIDVIIKPIDNPNDDDNTDVVLPTDPKVGESTCSNCIDFNCKFIEQDTVCNTTYEYEFVKYSASCPEGYVAQNGICVKTTNENIKATANYKDAYTKVVDAKYNPGGYYKVYKNYTTDGGDYYSYCMKGTMSNGFCYEYAAKETSTSKWCPAGYTRSGDYCYKYADIITDSNSSCPSGYVKNNNACYKYADLITSSSKTCPAGYTASGSGDNLKCTKSVAASKLYTAWGNPIKTYSTTSQESTYTNDLEKKVLLGSNKIGLTTTYTYAIYKRSTYYSCTNGTLSNTSCIISTNPIAGSSTTSCPSGYTRSGDTCYIKTNLIVSDDSYCPSGYTRSGNTCYIRTNAYSATYSECPSGYTERSNGTCYRRSNPVEGYTPISYNCPSGYTKTGSGTNTKCYKELYSEGNYYCENVEAKLKNDKCIITMPKVFDKYTCPAGYALNDNMCFKASSETTTMIWTAPEYKYSTSTYLEGYQRTGVSKYHMVCTPVDEIVYK